MHPVLTTLDVAELRAKCPKCRKTVAVRRRGKALRMKAHKRAGSHSWSSSVPCKVTDLDALPAVREWIAEQRDDAARTLTHVVERRAQLAAEASALDRTMDAAHDTTWRMDALAVALGEAT